MSTDHAQHHGLDDRGHGPEVGRPRRRWFPATAAALTAGVLWIGSGVLNRVLLWNLDSVPYQVINLLVPPALDFSLRPGEYQVRTLAVLTAVVVAAVVGAITHLTARTLPTGSSRLPLFIGSWFAAVVASAIGSTLQVVTAFVDQWDPPSWGAVVNGLIPYLTGGGWWGLALGWVVGLVGVLSHQHVSHTAPQPDGSEKT